MRKRVSDQNSETFYIQRIWYYEGNTKQILPSNNYVEHREGKDRIFTEELHEDLRSVLQALKDAGADDSYKAPNLGYSVREFCSEGSISILFDEVFGFDIEIETI